MPKSIIRSSIIQFKKKSRNHKQYVCSLSKSYGYGQFTHTVYNYGIGTNDKSIPLTMAIQCSKCVKKGGRFPTVLKHQDSQIINGERL